MNDARKAAEALAELFPAIYLRLHARHFKRGHRANSAGVAVLQPLAMAGPLTVGEAATHFDRAQSVVSEIVDRLVGAGLAERMRDERDRRRVLVWLTPLGFDELERDRQVLSRKLVLSAMQRMKPAARRALLDGMRALVAASDEAAQTTTKRRTR
jgi:DNA-binding MarR family transcriptional regulator